MFIFLQAAGSLAVGAHHFVHARVGHAFGEILNPDHGILVLAQHFDDDQAFSGYARMFEARITIIAIGNDFDQRAHHIFADRLIRLLNCHAVCVL